MEGIIDFIEALIKAPFICLGWLAVGFLAGGLARYFMRSADHLFISDIMLGLTGALVGGFITGNLLGFESETSGLGLVIVNLVIATLSAMVLIYIGRVLFGNKPGARGRRRRR
ncbi:MAG: GlsB/YeaQ/YmgE family stress response membrane protein [Chloroflexota bacterium]